MTILNVPDIHCNKCLERISNALTREKIPFNVNLQFKTVAVDGDDTAVKRAIEVLDDLGFDSEISKD